jgi:hypothetical protein
MRPFGTHDVVFIIEDQEIEWPIRGVAGQVKMPGDAEVFAKGVSVSLTGRMAAGSLNSSPKSLRRALSGRCGLWSVCEFTMVRVCVGTTRHR